MSDDTKSNWIVDTTDETFAEDVIERSKQIPVVVDFWAQWCAPCRTLAPVLEKLAEEFQGQLVLAKANTEFAGQAASGFGVSGIPAVFAVIDGEPVDTFQGALPEEEVRKWLESVLSRGDLREAKGLIDSDPARAEQLLRGFLGSGPDDADTEIALAQALLAQQKYDECHLIIDELEARGFLEPAAEKVKAALQISAIAGHDVTAARAAVENAPEDFQLKLELAKALAGSEEYVDAMEICLTLVTLDRKKTGEAARQLMVDIFRVLPDDSELTREYRRKLSMALY